MNVLYVCSGNICRSPMAEGCLRDRAEIAGFGELRVGSAGTLGISGSPASPEAIRAMAELGTDIGRHRSRGLTTDLVRESDLLVVMTRAHLDEVHRRFPPARGRRFLLRAFENGPRPDARPPDLDDPIGLPVEVYREQARIILRCSDHLLDYLRAGDP
jgi:protein-tyrosine-phosphatase